MRSRVFLSYSITDEHFAHQIRAALADANISTIVDPLGLGPGDLISASVSKALAASDFIILLVSPDALRSPWMVRELEALTLQEWQQRAITVIPVKVRPCVVPLYLSRWHALDLTRSFHRGLDRLVRMVRLAPSIDLLRLSESDFECLVIELLRAYGFRKIKYPDTWQDGGFDLMAEYRGKDPFGREMTEQWIVEVKGARNKTDISALRRFIGSLSWGERLSALFVTSTQLTSAAKEWILSLQKQSMPPRLTVLEGTDVVRLLLEKTKVAEKFFSGEGY